MKNTSIFLFNLVLYVIYAFVSIFIVNFLYGLILKVFGKDIPGAQDPVHMKMAVVVIVVVAILTLVGRKALYISFYSLKDKEGQGIQVDNTMKEEPKQEEVVAEEVIAEKEKKTEEIKEETKGGEEDLEIYINKERR